MPPLRERPKDLLPLVHRLIASSNVILGRQVKGFTKDCEERMLANRWPGNLRELYSRIFLGVYRTTGEPPESQ